jgi:hypothetical protein
MGDSVSKEGFNWGEPEPAKKFSVVEFVKNYKTQTEKASVVRKGGLIDAFIRVSLRILAKFREFAKQAVEIAVSKFLVELCAMIIAGISTALASRHGRGIDISTPGVFYNKSPATGTTAAPSNQGSLWDRGSSASPFDSGWNRSGPAW